MYSIILFLILLAGFILSNKGYKKMSVWSTIATVIFLALALFTFIPEIPDIQKSLVDYGQYVALMLFIGILAGTSFAILVSVMFVIIGADLFTQAVYGKNLSVNILEKSRKHLGGVLFLETKYNGVLSKGYLRFIIRSPFNEVNIFKQEYNETTKKGVLNARFKNDVFYCKWNIPENFVHGEFNIDVEVRDVIALFRLRIPYLVKKHNLKVIINEKSQKQIVSIHKVTNPNLRDLTNICSNDSSLEGWICLKMQNTKDYDVDDCFGTVNTDIGSYDVYDYELFKKNEKNEMKPNLENYRIFSIKSNSTKRLYANIKSTQPQIAVHFDFDDEEINEQFSIV